MILAACWLAGGCAAHWPEQGNPLAGPQQSYRVPPKQLLQMVKEAVTQPPLALGVVAEKDGTITTGYQSFPGDWHVARRWQERTQYQVNVIPDWNDPAAAGRIEVRAVTEQRAAEGMKWATAPELQRPERAEQLLKALDEQIRNRAGRAGGADNAGAATGTQPAAQGR
ncbi:MAG TPA: hypothetical protein VER17_02995 [Tepidisphaeraceae bacterium]|nr:hypothetical protein [Tepidisphaeraceae bacterium]